MGILQITKMDNGNTPLEGAEFSLYTDSTCKDEDKLFTAVSGSDGIASIRGIPSPQVQGITWTIP